MKKTYDVNCHYLAEHFLQDFRFASQNERLEHCDRLASRIQEEIEHYIDEMQLDERA